MLLAATADLLTVLFAAALAMYYVQLRFKP